MTIELKMLALSIVLGLVQIVLSAQSKNLQHGYRWAAGPRDEPRPQPVGIAGRLERALANYLETFPLFAAAVFIAHAARQHDWMTIWGSQLYFWARVVYLPLYVFGVVLVRSLVWNVATLGIVLILLSLALLSVSLRSWRSRRRRAWWRGYDSRGASGWFLDRPRSHSP